MTDCRARVRRLTRLQAVGESRAQSHENLFARAVAEEAGAAANLSHIEGLILSASPLAIAGNGAGLAAAAQLRALLLPAAEMAETRLQSALARRTDAEARMAQSRARNRCLNDIVQQARVAASRHAEQAEADARPAPRQKAQP